MAKLLVIVGPTAVGKSQVALLAAQMLQGEIISADSVQVYRRLNIGAAKPSAREQQLVPHHLLDMVEPEDNYTVADFHRHALAAIEDVQMRKHLPVLTGGTGLYVRAVTHNYSFSAPGGNDALRTVLRNEAECFGPEYLYRKLSACDPQSAEKIHPHDLRRVIRALEVYEQSRQPLSVQQEKDSGNRYRTFMFGLTLPRDLLYQRIEERVDKMIAQGLVDEVRELLASGVPPCAKAMMSLGYRHITAYLKGEMSLPQAVDLLKRDTRRYAKRQLTWFRRDQDITWLDVSREGGTSRAAENICNKLAGE